MLVSGIIFFILIGVYLFVEMQKGRKTRQINTEEETRKALLESILKNNKDRSIGNY